MGTKRHVVRWSAREYEIVLRTVATKMTTGGFGHGEFVKLLRAAQSILPPDRQRRLEKGAIGPNLHPLEEKAKAYYRDMHEAAQKDAIANRGACPQPSEDACLQTKTLEEQLGEIGRQLAAIVMAAFSEEVIAALTAVRREAVELVATPPQPAVAKQPRILIVGTKSEWRYQLRNDIGKKAVLDFFDDPTGSGGLAARCRRSDAVLLNGSMCRHTHQSVARASGRPMRVAHGGYSTLLETVNEILTKEIGR